MTGSITDANGAAITVLSMSLASGAESAALVIGVPCLAGQFLAAGGAASAAVLARVQGGGGAFADISAAPISLTPYDGQTVSFELKVQAGDVAGLKRVAIPVRVTYSP